jgi:hypothetical protein
MLFLSTLERSLVTIPAMDSIDVSVLLFWIFSLIGGIAVGVQKGQEVSGFIWPLLFGPLGFLIVLCLPNLKKRALDIAQYNLQAQQMELQRQQLAEMRALRESSVMPTSRVVKTSRPLPKIKVAKNGEEWAELTMEEIGTLLESGDLTVGDYYYSNADEDWVTLDRLFDVSPLG